MTGPLRAEVRRGPLVESRHVVHAVVADADGVVLRSWGDTERMTHPRSAIKSWQALPLVESGAADAFELSPVELALACASHNGETAHVAAVDAWLRRIGCTHVDLECGAQDGRVSTAAANNCSGKHAGFLTLARHLGVPTAGYVAADHPVQQLVTEAVAAAHGVDIDPALAGTDGCGIPVHPVPLRTIATAGARLGFPPGGWEPARRDAVRRLVAATVAEPWYVAGTGRLCTELLEQGQGSVLVKVGAEGVQLAALPRLGLGIALKVEDGDRAASEVALGHVLDAVDPTGAAGREAVFGPRRELRNHTGTLVGTWDVQEG